MYYRLKILVDINISILVNINDFRFFYIKESRLNITNNIRYYLLTHRDNSFFIDIQKSILPSILLWQNMNGIGCCWKIDLVSFHVKINYKYLAN